MPRRIEIELTSRRDDATWTWRAAGAKAPKGTVAASVLPPEATTGQILRVDAEFFVDGIEITGVVASKEARQEPDRLELLVSSVDEPLVTTTLASRGRDDRGPRRDGPRRDGPRRDRDDGRPGRGGPRPEREGGDQNVDARKRPDRNRPAERDGGDRKDRPPRRTRPETPPIPVVERPKPKRLRAGKAHRAALLAELPEEHRPVAEQVVLGGLPAVRAAIEKQNAERTAAGEAPVASGPLLELAEKLVPRVRAAEWRDRAEAAQRDLDVLDLRDLRSVVSAADAAAKDDESRTLAKALREGLAVRADAEHQAWLAELVATVGVGRIVRALRLSSRPPKAGAPLPAELSAKLVAGASEALTADAAAERWVAVLDALAFAPVHDKVIPASLPADVHPDVRATIARLATRIPKIAHIFEIAPDRNAPRPKMERRRPPKKPARPPKPDPAQRSDAPPAPDPVEPPSAEVTAVEPTAPDEVAPAEPTSVEPTVAEQLEPPASPESSQRDEPSPAPEAD